MYKNSQQFLYKIYVDYCYAPYQIATARIARRTFSFFCFRSNSFRQNQYLVWFVMVSNNGFYTHSMNPSPPLKYRHNLNFEHLFQIIQYSFVVSYNIIEIYYLIMRVSRIEHILYKNLAAKLKLYFIKSSI